MGSGLAEPEGTELAMLAVAAVAARLAHRAIPRPHPASAALRACGASFVTLEVDGSLRGCIGTLDAARPLYLDVTRNAVRAMNDPRLPPVTPADWPELDVTVSVLSTPQPVAVSGLEALLAMLRPGVDGLLLTDGVRRATFLPKVWAKVPEPDKFVAALLRKGGWPADGWPVRVAVRRYTAVEFFDRAPREPWQDGGHEPG
jgi:AmmeMemoRadiSam system protein A